MRRQQLRLWTAQWRVQTRSTGSILLALVGFLTLLITVQPSALAQDAAAVELRRLEARDKPGQRTSELGNAYHNLAIQLRNAGQFGRAEEPARRALAIWEEVHGENSGAAANACNTLAATLDQLRKDAEAEHYARRALRIWEQVHGLDSGQAANALNTLIGIMRTRGRWADAEMPARRVLRIWTKTNGPESDAVANASNTLSDVLQHVGKFREAEQLARDAVRILQKLHGADSDAADNARNTLAGALDRLGKKDEALREQRRVLESWSKRFGPRSTAVALGANNLAWKQLGAGHYEDAEKLFQQTLDIWSETDTRPSKPSTGIPLSGLARTAMLQRDWDRAYSRVKQAVQISIDRTRAASAEADRTRASRAPSEIAQAWGNLQVLIKVAHQIVAAEPSRSAALARETYGYAQWRIGSRAAEALAALAGRVAVDPALAPVIRQRQDLEGRWQAIDRKLEDAGNRPAQQRDKNAEQRLLDEAKSIEGQLRDLDKRLSKDFAKYAAIARLEPLTVEETQALLNPDEALVLLLPTGAEPPIGEETFVWVVTKGDVRWVRSTLGASDISGDVATLRCGLDAAEWFTDSSECPKLTGTTYSRANYDDRKPLPFDAARAHRLYTALFGGIEDLIRDKKQLLLVPSGALTTLPFQVLVTKAPESGAAVDLSKLAWVIRDHAMTVLPAVISLSALRQAAKPSAATKPIIGFANPLLDGNQADRWYGAYYKELAEIARARTDCATAAPQRVASLRAVSRGPLSVPQTAGLVDPAQLRIQTPLPDTADEVCGVARSLAADVAEMRLGARATETEVKRLSATGELAKHRIIHFATHGTLAGQLGIREPGLILSPPKTATPEDDGYLSASEIAGLKLDADWVILSACDTAGGAGRGEAAEALSGVARAFFYAQARALLVSHWPVDSTITVKLVTGAFARMAADRSVGRAEALRLSMLALIASGDADAQPANWAPFVVVGEGAVGR